MSGWAPDPGWAEQGHDGGIVTSTLPRPELEPEPPDPCHLLDSQNRALCLRPIPPGRQPHAATTCERLGHTICPVCLQIREELRRMYHGDGDGSLP